METTHGSPGPSSEQLQLQPATPTPLTIRILGTLRIDRSGTRLSAHDLGGTKPRQILELLLLQLGRPLSKERLIALLWDGHPPAEALPTLESYVCVLRRHLQPGSSRTGPLQTVNGGYVIERSLVELDLDRFDTLYRHAQQSDAATGLPMLREALTLATAPLLGDELLPLWAAEERALHSARVSAARIMAAESASALCLAEEAVGWAHLALVDDPLNEHAWTALVLGLEQAGRPAEGLQAYESFRQALDRELGCAPGGILRAAQVRLLQATADGELSYVLAALLMLHDQHRRATRPVVGATHPHADLPARESLREAGKVVDSFLRRVRIEA
ncbi:MULTISPECIES: BTAD domain-containing putative transcriptional regulator [Cryobacterium]|uniref:Response regulator receiver protein n=1 Tax=Cryobacterium breve TaxID=1259258 RepID=A0ABY2IXJ8_9MICO|nr:MULTISPECIES: BTAD domain-containing putative transcriptional regulator [Cryobacterium]TFC93941.1 response regulator receiver protein [Cryobacterium sp. TmT3-12]TFC95114.1 response regulator receiver protein [Cryobacterium breve]